MSITIKLNNTVFKNPDLPRLPQIIRKGLVGAYRFSNSEENSILDLSGNGNDLVPVGSVKYTPQGVIGNNILGGFNTGVKETPNMTMIVVYRLDTSIGINSALVMGNFQNISYPSSDPLPDDYGVTGTSFYSQIDNSNLFFRSRFQAVSRRLIPRGDNSIDLNLLSNKGNGELNLISDGKSLWLFAAISIDSNANTVNYFNSAQSVDSFYDSYSNATQKSEYKFDLGSRPLNKKPLGILGYNMSIKTSHSLGAEISDAYIYDRALSETEIVNQYKMTKLYLEKDKGIII